MSKQPKPKVEKLFRNLHVELTADEFKERSTELARTLSEKRGLEQKLASIRSSIKAEIDEADAKITKLHQIVSENAEWRDVECEKHVDYAKKKAWFVNLVTGEVFGERNLMASELQEELEFEEATYAD